MTGAFVHKHGVISSRDALGDGLARPWPRSMRGRGYRTVAFSANPWITPEFRFDRGFDEFESGRAMGAQLTNLYQLLRARRPGAGGARRAGQPVRLGVLGRERQPEQLGARPAADRRGGRVDRAPGRRPVLPLRPPDRPARPVRSAGSTTCASFREPGWDGRVGPHRAAGPRADDLRDGGAARRAGERRPDRPVRRRHRLRRRAARSHARGPARARPARPHAGRGHRRPRRGVLRAPQLAARQPALQRGRARAAGVPPARPAARRRGGPTWPCWSTSSRPSSAWSRRRRPRERLDGRALFAAADGRHAGGVCRALVVRGRHLRVAHGPAGDR